MIRKIKALGLALVAIAALSAMGASAAQAGSLDIGAQPAVLTGTSESVHKLSFTSTGGSVFTTSCPIGSASLEATTQGQTGVTDITATATYGPNCTAFGLAAQVVMHGCKYRLTGEGQPAFTALVDITGCTPGKEITIKTALCTLDIPEQKNLSHVFAKNINPTPPNDKEVTLESTVTNIELTQTGAGCPDGNAHVSKTASFVGNTIIKAFKHAGTKQVTKHEHQYTEALCGEQVTLLAT